MSKALGYCSCCGESYGALKKREAEIARLRADITQLDSDREQLRHEVISLRTLIAQKDAKVASLEAGAAQRQRILLKTFGKDRMWQLLNEEIDGDAALEVGRKDGK